MRPRAGTLETHPPAASGCTSGDSPLSRFHTTRWTLVDAAAESDVAALAELLERYRGPIYAFLRSRGHAADRADDLTQGFIADVVLGRALVARADAARGRFRTFLLTALRRYVIDEHRRESVVGRGSARAMDPELMSRSEVAVAAASDPADAFERAWSRACLEAATARCARDCNDQGLDEHWRLFEARVLAPVRTGGAAPELAPLMGELGIHDRQRAYDMIAVVRRRLEQCIRLEVLETLEDPAELDDERRGVLALLGA